jgi:hypothetical protein
MKKKKMRNYFNGLQTQNTLRILVRYSERVKRYRVAREATLPTSRPLNPWTYEKDVDLATFEGKYPRPLFNKGVRAENEDHVGHVMKETDDKIIVFGDHNFRYDIPKSPHY